MNKVECLILVIPGREHLLEKCLESIKPVESILNVNIISDVNLKEQEVRYNHFHESKSNLITWLSDDDLFVNSGALEECLQQLENPNVVGASTVANLIYYEGNSIRKRYNFNPYSKRLHQQSVTHVHELTVVKREVAVNYVDDIFLSLNHHHLWYLTNMMVRHGEWYKSKKVGYEWRIHHTNAHRQATTDQYKLAREKFLTP